MQKSNRKKLRQPEREQEKREETRQKGQRKVKKKRVWSLGGWEGVFERIIIVILTIKEKHTSKTRGK